MNESRGTKAEDAVRRMMESKGIWSQRESREHGVKARHPVAL